MASRTRFLRVAASSNKRLDRFTLRTQPKVNTQWHLYCLVQNIEKLAHHGYGGGRPQ